MEDSIIPGGFLGTEADLLMDVVLLSFVVIVPAIAWSWGKARQRRYSVHKTTQLSLAGILGVAVLLFEIDLKMSGGIFGLTADSAYAGTLTLNGWIYGHTAAALLTSVIWIALIVFSLKRFPKPPAPGPFSRTHRFWGRAGMISMLVTGITSFPVYYFGFMK